MAGDADALGTGRKAPLSAASSGSIVAPDGAPPAERLARWREAFQAVVLDVDVQAKPDAFAARVDTWRLPGLLAARYDMSPIEMTRSRHTTEASDDNVTLSFPQAGTLSVGHRFAQADLAPGSAVLLPAREPSRVALPEGGRFIGLLLPREALTEICGSRHLVGARVIESAPALSLLGGYVAGLSGLDPGTLAANGRLFGAHMLDLVGAVLRPPAAVADDAPGLAAARKARLLRGLQTLATDPSLSLAGFARRMGVPERTVQAVFAAAGSSFSEALRAHRLDAAGAALRAPSEAHRSVADIAFGAGFADLSTFNRLFRGRYGCRPSEWRAEAARAA